MTDHFAGRQFLAERGLNRCLVGQISREHFHRYLDRVMTWAGESPTTEDVNELIVASASARGRA